MTAFPDPVGWWTSLGKPLRALPRPWAIAVAALLVLALCWAALSAPPGGVPRTEAAEVTQASGEPSDTGDVALYARIHGRVAHGENYYHAALDEHRSSNYPTIPFVTIRPPTLAWLNAAIGDEGLRWLGIALLVATVLVWERRLEAHANLGERAAACVLIFMSGLGVFDARSLLLHELLAGVLLSLALGLYRPERIWPSLLAAAAAVALRELAVHFVLLWLGFALLQRRRREATILLALLALFVIGMWLHYEAVAAARLPGDLPSQGWSAVLGFDFALTSLARLSALLLLPLWLALPLALLPLLGWIGLGGRTGLFASLWFAAFLAGVAVFAREQNFYWVLMVLPVYPAGLALVPRALGDLAHALMPTKET